MIGQPILRIIPPELHGEEAEILRRVSAGETINRYETERVGKNGKKAGSVFDHLPDSRLPGIDRWLLQDSSRGHPAKAGSVPPRGNR